MIIDAYCRMRTIDNTIPDDVLDFMKNAAIEKLEKEGETTQPLVNGVLVKKDDYALVFDSKEYRGDIGNNSIFWKRAKVLKVYWYDAQVGSSDWVVDVEFEDGRVSKAHFLTGISPCK